MKATPGKAKQPPKPLTKVPEKAHKVVTKAGVTKAGASKAGASKSAAAKPVAKAATKTATKPPSKPAAKATPKGELAAVAKKPPAVAPRTGSKPAPRPAVKAAAGKPPTTDTPVTTLQAKAALKPESPPSPPISAPAATATTIQRPGRPSSRLASLTVPSMAQSVASTAAKSSYSQIAAAPLIVPPLPSATKKDPKLANNWKSKPAEDLTDAELLAMPDSEYMNEKQMAAFRLKLATLKQEILNSAGETTEHLREDTVVVPDPADRATIEEEHALELRTRDRERKLLKKIEQSIGRIDAGDYGYCDETGEPIGVGRLLARPTATLSLEAQQRRELKQKMFGD